jgi:hypothetical protein
VPYYYLARGAAAAGYLVVWKLRRSRLGFRLQALRDEPDAAASLGIAIARHKVLAFMISAAMMSVAGTFYAQYVLVLDPERLFSTEISIIVLLSSIIREAGTLYDLQWIKPMLMQTPVPERCIVLAYLLITHFSLYDLPKIFSTDEPNRFRDSHLDDPISINDVTSGDKHALPNMEC